MGLRKLICVIAAASPLLIAASRVEAAPALPMQPPPPDDGFLATLRPAPFCPLADEPVVVHMPTVAAPATPTVNTQAPAAFEKTILSRFPPQQDYSAAAIDRRHLRLMKLAEEGYPGIALCLAARDGFLPTVDDLFARYENQPGFDPNTRLSGNTPLMWAALFGSGNCVGCLVAKPNVIRDGAAQLTSDPAIKATLADFSRRYGTYESNVHITASVRYPGVYRSLLQLAKSTKFPAKPRILLIGPGYKEGVSPQLIELMLLFPQARFTIIEKDAAAAKAIRAGNFYGPAWQAKFPNPRDAESVAFLDLFRRRYQQEFASSKNPLARVEVRTGDIADVDLDDEIFDVVFCTHSIRYALDHARRGEEAANGYAKVGREESGTIVDNVFSAVREGGLLFVESLAEPYFAHSQLATLQTKFQTEQVLVYERIG